MKRIIGLSLVTANLLFTACDNQKAATPTAQDSAAAMAIDSMAVKTFDVSLVDNKKDPTCGMPVNAGISDTAHYDNHVIGFCSSECKADFLKNPTANIAAAELKTK
jgi:YHS domain-containing protein